MWHVNFKLFTLLCCTSVTYVCMYMCNKIEGILYLYLASKTASRYPFIHSFIRSFIHLRPLSHSRRNVYVMHVCHVCTYGYIRIYVYARMYHVCMYVCNPVLSKFQKKSVIPDVHITLIKKTAMRYVLYRYPTRAPPHRPQGGREPPPPPPPQPPFPKPSQGKIKIKIKGG